jgi:enoyl-CoA hydratase/carnithine racemase
VILGSAVPRRFCAGLQLDSLRDAPPSRGYALVEKLYSGLCEAQFRLGKPSIAAVGGTAQGGGMTLAIHCDMIVAADTATFGYPEIDVRAGTRDSTPICRASSAGIAPSICCSRGVRSMRRKPCRWGWSTAWCQNSVMEEARALARSLCQKSPEIMRMGRQAFMRANDIDYRRGVAGAVETFGNIFATEDAQEGIAAFVERRKPRWQA